MNSFICCDTRYEMRGLELDGSVSEWLCHDMNF